MAKQSGFDRRSFLKGAGMTALAGAVGTQSVTAAAAETARASGVAYNFDEVYDRIGTECIKWDSQVTKWGDGKIKVGMGIADMDFRNAPVHIGSIAETHRTRELGLHPRC